MGIGVLVIGESGTGKSSSLRNLKSEEVSIINVEGKPLPFRNDFRKVVNLDDAGKIAEQLKKASSKIVVVDDVQYIMANEFMRRGKEKGFEKFTDIGINIFNVFEAVKQMPHDVIVYFFGHCSTDDTGTVRFKTIGKMIDEKITVEGKFTIVLKTAVADGNYFFQTQNSGKDTVKSPMGMFNDFYILNDLKAVDTAIREFYNLAQIPATQSIKQSPVRVRQYANSLI